MSDRRTLVIWTWAIFGATQAVVFYFGFISPGHIGSFWLCALSFIVGVALTGLWHRARRLA